MMVSRSHERLSPDHVTLKWKTRKKRVSQTQTFVRLSQICNCTLIYTSYKASVEGQSDRSMSGNVTQNAVIEVDTSINEA